MGDVGSTLEGVSPPPRTGRPRSSSRDTLAEAACELFLERGYDATSITDITTRAGVSRSSFFNYFSTKADVLWGGLDERIAALGPRLRAQPAPGTDAALRVAVAAIGEELRPDVLALAIAHAGAMGIVDELHREAALRRARIAAPISEQLQRSGVDALHADVVAAAFGAAVLAAVFRWAELGAGRLRLSALLAEALRAVPDAVSGGIRQLRVVVRTDDIEAAAAFYRDVVGMPERAAFSGDGGARVVILDAGAATLELADPAQVEMIDRVETDGDAASDRIRIALEVDDATAATVRLADGGAQLQATPRLTPWGSLNSRLRAPADLQLTLFQEHAAE